MKNNKITINLNKKTRSEILSEVAAIKSVEVRSAMLREVCKQDRAITLICQYTYHPDMVFDLPEGDLPAVLTDKSETITTGGLAYHMIRFNWHTLTKKDTTTPKHRKEVIFQDKYNSIHPEDRKVLIGMKDKKLPWRNLGEKFVRQALPELFVGVEEVA